MNPINRYFNDDIYLLTTSNDFFDFSRAEKPMPRPNLQPLMADYVPEARENVSRKRTFSSSQQDVYNIDNSKDEKWKEDAEMIRTRWDVKCLADPNVNLTVSNYRKRVFGDNRPPPRREFKRDVLFEKSSSLTENNDNDDRKEVEDELLKKDQKSLNERIEIINVKYDQAKFKLESDFQNRATNEARFNCFAYQVQYDYNFNEYYSDFQSELNQIEESRQSEIDSFKELFKSGEYKKGTLHEYTTLEIYQPSAKRRKYDDDGFRRTILPQRLIDSIHVENELYHRFYNKPH